MCSGRSSDCDARRYQLRERPHGKHYEDPFHERRFEQIDLKPDSPIVIHRSRLVAIGDAAFFLLALASLAYASITALRVGSDLAFFQDMGRAWAEGTYQIGEGKFYGHPPFSSVLYAPLSLLTFEQGRVILVGVNLLATAVILLMAYKLWGSTWSGRTRLRLAAFLLALAPFRVAVRYGQISLIVTALLLGALFAWKRNSKILAGLLLGLSLSKYSLTLPFALYFVWRREWKITVTALLFVSALTEIFAFRLGLSVPQVIADYFQMMSHISISHDTSFAGATEIGPLLFAFTGNESVASALNIALAVFAIVATIVVFRRRPQYENLHVVILTLFSLWYVYHRIYDAVICIVPAAFCVDLIVRERSRWLGRGSMAALSLMVLSIPGLLTQRLHLEVDRISANPAGFVGLHVERILIFGLFCLFLTYLWRTAPADRVDVGCSQLENGP